MAHHDERTTSSLSRERDFCQSFDVLFVVEGLFGAEVYPENMSDDEDIPEEIDSLRNFCGLQTRDVNARHQVLKSLERTIKAWTNRSIGNVGNGGDRILFDLLPCILRLSAKSPFPDVRESCSEYLRVVKVGNLQEKLIAESFVQGLTAKIFNLLFLLDLGKRNKGSSTCLQGANYFYPI